MHLKFVAKHIRYCVATITICLKCEFRRNSYTNSTNHPTYYHAPVGVHIDVIGKVFCKISTCEVVGNLLKNSNITIYLVVGRIYPSNFTLRIPPLFLSAICYKTLLHVYLDHESRHRLMSCMKMVAVSGYASGYASGSG